MSLVVPLKENQDNSHVNLMTRQAHTTPTEKELIMETQRELFGVIDLWTTKKQQKRLNSPYSASTAQADQS